jgi:hypothetical protein
MMSASKPTVLGLYQFKQKETTMLNRMTTNEDAFCRCEVLFQMLDAFLVDVLHLQVPLCQHCGKCLSSHKPCTETINYVDLKGRQLSVTSLGLILYEHLKLQPLLHALQNKVDTNGQSTYDYQGLLQHSMHTLHTYIIPLIKEKQEFMNVACQNSSCGGYLQSVLFSCFDLLDKEQQKFVDMLTSVVASFLDNNEKDPNESKTEKDSFCALATPPISNEEARTHLQSLQLYLKGITKETCAMSLRCTVCHFEISKVNGLHTVDQNHAHATCKGKGTSLPQLVNLISYYLCTPEGQEHNMDLMQVYSLVMERLTFYTTHQLSLDQKMEYYNTFCLCWKPGQPVVKCVYTFRPCLYVDEKLLQTIASIRQMCQKFGQHLHAAELKRTADATSITT